MTEAPAVSPEKPASSPKKKEGSTQLARPRGTQDILPQEQKYWEYVAETARAILRGWHYQQIDTPIFEDTALFIRGVGEETDVVSKELFELKSRSKGSHYALRPEGTAPVARAYIEHGMKSWPHPIKLFYIGPFFRYERPQAGRWRQHHQLGMEVFGAHAPVTDAQLLYVAYLIFQQLGLEDYIFKVNTLGKPEERKAYVKVLKEHYRRNRKKLCKDCKVRLTTNPLRMLDCKEEKCQQLAHTAPQLIDHLSTESQNYFKAVCSLLDALEVPYQASPSLVRGLDYYTDTVFEAVPKSDPEARSFASGGRYNNLVKTLGGRAVSAIGISIGLERTIERIKAEGIELMVTDEPHIFVAQLGEAAKVEALRVMRQLQEARIPFAESIDRDGMQAQLRAADRLGVPWALIIGQKEVLDKTVILRNMESGMQEVVPRDTLGEELRKRLNLSNE